VETKPFIKNKNHLPSFSIYLFIILIFAYVYLNMYTHFPPFPYSYTFLTIFICIVCVMFYTYNHVFVWILLFPKLDRHLCYGVYWCDHTPTHILILWFRLYFHFVTCTSTMSKSNIKFTTTWHKQCINRNMTKIQTKCNSNSQYTHAQHKKCLQIQT